MLCYCIEAAKQSEIKYNCFNFVNKCSFFYQWRDYYCTKKTYTLVEPTVKGQVQDPLAMLLLNKRLYICHSVICWE